MKDEMKSLPESAFSGLAIHPVNENDKGLIVKLGTAYICQFILEKVVRPGYQLGCEYKVIRLKCQLPEALVLFPEVLRCHLPLIRP